jgi:hypothetical protein
LTFSGLDGGTRWTIPEEVLAAAPTIVGDALFVQNDADQNIEVDPTTGTELRRVTNVPMEIIGGWELYINQSNGDFEMTPT